MKRSFRASRIRGTTIALSAIACVAVAASCTENLPSGPNTFTAQVQIVVPHDTLVVGDSSVVTAKAVDASGHVIQLLKFGWTSADSTIVGFAAPAADADGVNGRSRTLIGRKPGRSVVSLALPDLRFVTAAASRTQTVVVGGVKVLTSHDTTLTAINDTGVVIATSLVKSNGALVNRASQGIKWTHLGSHTTVVGQGDTIKYVAKSNGPDTLIATHDLCLITAKCADTVVARVGQLLTLTLDKHSFTAWSFSDSVGPSVTLADRRGNGLAGTSVRFVPATPADSAIVKIAGPFGVSNPTTGTLAAPLMISSGNGTAKVRVLALLPDGFSVVAIDSVTETVRQVARRVAVEPLRGTIDFNDSIAIKPVARDARGAAIPDATITLIPINVTVNGVWIGPVTPAASPISAGITPVLTGIALPDSNPAAPQIPVVVDASQLTFVKVDTLTAGNTSKLIDVAAYDSTGQPAAGRWIRFGTSAGVTPDSVQLDNLGVGQVTWTPGDSAATYVLTGIRGTVAPMTTLADSAGRIMVRRSILVKPDVPSELKSTAAIDFTNIPVSTAVQLTITVKDKFGNKIKTATGVPGAEFTATATGGTIGAFTCTAGVCVATYTAPAAAGTQTINVKIGPADILGSPISMVIHP